MSRWATLLSALLTLDACAAAPIAETPAGRGQRYLLTRSYNPPTMPAGSVENAWRMWGLSEKPADYAERFRRRYGLHPAPYPNGGLPMGLRLEPRTVGLGKGLTTDCLICHGGSVLGRSYVGLGNTTLDFLAFYEEMNGAPGRPAKAPFRFTRVRGTVEAGAMSVFLIGYREPDLSLRLTFRDLGLFDDLCEDVPAWWLLKKKATMYYTGGADTRSARSIMQFMMSPLNFPSAFHRAEGDFKDVLAYLKSIEAPKYPLAIDRAKAAEGELVFKDNCARCHGTYGERPTYPNKVVPLAEIGTDRRRYDGITAKFGEYYNRTWFAGDYKAIPSDGYQAPPLDGVWATAPYLHNGSVPTLDGVLNSKARPPVWRRPLRTDRDMFDERLVGWKVDVLPAAPAGLTGLEAREVYDTAQVGRGNGGHLYGDRLSEAERAAVIEYLKTL